MRLTPAQITYVHDNYQTKNYREMAEELGVSWDALRHHAAKELGLKRGRWGRLGWTAEEKDKLRQMWPVATRAALTAALPSRSWPSMVHMAQRLGLIRPLSVEYREQLARILLPPSAAGYIAGIIDGEGSVFLLKVRCVSQRKDSPKVSGRPRQQSIPAWRLVAGIMMCNTDLKMIRYVHSRVGGTIFTRTKFDAPSRKLKSHTPLHILNIRGFAALPVLQAVKSFMITKQAAACVVEEYLTLRLAKQKNASMGMQEEALHAKWRRLCPRKGSPEWALRYTT